jgi:hypothetical protein
MHVLTDERKSPTLMYGASTAQLPPEQWQSSLQVVAAAVMHFDLGKHACVVTVTVGASPLLPHMLAAMHICSCGR